MYEEIENIFYDVKVLNMKKGVMLALSDACF